jgi:NAD(P)-dependent dehydrogenase (short-subunit alcohol dehydrogenase family)
MSKAILLTGTSQGIGHALTKLLLINGYRVIGTNTTGIDNINGRLSPEESAQKYFNLSQAISKPESFGMWRQKRNVHGKKLPMVTLLIPFA